MFANLCSHMVLAASTNRETKAKTVTTATKKSTKTEEYKAFWFSYYDYDTYREKNKKRNAKLYDII